MSTGILPLFYRGETPFLNTKKIASITLPVNIRLVKPLSFWKRGIHSAKYDVKNGKLSESYLKREGEFFPFSHQAASGSLKKQSRVLGIFLFCPTPAGSFTKNTHWGFSKRSALDKQKSKLKKLTKSVVHPDKITSVRVIFGKGMNNPETSGVSRIVILLFDRFSIQSASSGSLEQTFVFI